MIRSVPSDAILVPAANIFSRHAGAASSSSHRDRIADVVAAAVTVAFVSFVVGIAVLVMRRWGEHHPRPDGSVTAGSENSEPASTPALRNIGDEARCVAWLRESKNQDVGISSLLALAAQGAPLCPLFAT